MKFARIKWKRQNPHHHQSKSSSLLPTKRSKSRLSSRQKSYPESQNERYDWWGVGASQCRGWASGLDEGNENIIKGAY